jgi:non-heme chloroperoxidase
VTVTVTATVAATAAGTVRRVVETSRRGLVYGRRGVGPAVVLVHGWCLNRRLWASLEERLVATGHEVLTPDLAGFGDSAALAGPYNLDRHAADLDDLLAETGLRDVTLVGFAFGAGVLLRLPSALADPLQDGPVRSLVLIGVPSAATAAYPRMPRAMRRDWPLFAERSAAAICRAEHSSATLTWLGAMFGGTALPVALETVDVLAAFEPAAVAAQVAVPSLFVHGELDDVVPLRVSEDCVARMPLAAVAPVPGSGHLVVLDAPEQLYDLVTAMVEDPAGAVSARAGHR